MQAWLFLSNSAKWTANNSAAARALITAVPKGSGVPRVVSSEAEVFRLAGRLLLLDLTSEALPQYQKFQSYFGQPLALEHPDGLRRKFGDAGPEWCHQSGDGVGNACQVDEVEDRPRAYPGFGLGAPISGGASRPPLATPLGQAVTSSTAYCQVDYGRFIPGHLDGLGLSE